MEKLVYKRFIVWSDFGKCFVTNIRCVNRPEPNSHLTPEELKFHNDNFFAFENTIAKMQYYQGKI